MLANAMIAAATAGDCSGYADTIMTSIDGIFREISVSILLGNNFLVY